ncbi:uncharacterized protein LOC141700112 [Apium graveolens]|uniref:uncharacterized protein LOC141700112 n=1 Tax=Apium graveolens TaxID=4045 RepID=UPI003D7C1437
MMPIEVGSPSHRAINFDEMANEEGLRTNIELIDEVRDQAIEKMKKYKEKTKEHFSKKSRVKNFQVGDLVLRDTEASDPTNTGKLMPRWEGPYKVKEVLRPGTYKLINMDESENMAWTQDQKILLVEKATKSNQKLVPMTSNKSMIQYFV